MSDFTREDLERTLDCLSYFLWHQPEPLIAPGAKEAIEILKTKINKMLGEVKD